LTHSGFPICKISHPLAVIVAAATGVNYVYDGDGRRVERSVSGSVTKIYWYDPVGNVLEETDGSGSATNSAFNE
jgi:YD repeat-containing protein